MRAAAACVYVPVDHHNNCFIRDNSGTFYSATGATIPVEGAGLYLKDSAALVVDTTIMANWSLTRDRNSRGIGVHLSGGTNLFRNCPTRASPATQKSEVIGQWFPF